MKRALITGGTSGIGKALSKLLEEKTIEVTAIGSKDADLSISREKVIALIHENKPDLVVNCAGFGLYGDAVKIPIKDQMRMIEVNISALLEITLEAANLLLKEGRSGTILNVASLASRFPTPGMATYGATKAFVTSFSEACDYELRKKGVRVLCSCPGMVETNFAKRAAGKEVVIRGEMSPEYVAYRIWKQIKKGRIRDIFPSYPRFFPSFLLNPVIYRSIQKRL